MSRSASGRRAFALASVVSMPSAAKSDAARFAIIRRSWPEDPPKDLLRRGSGIVSLL
jgi:hypothetical protein